MQYGNEWLIHKFNITKPYFEKNVKKQYSSFHKFVYDEILYPDQNKLSLAFVHNRASICEAAIGRIS